MIARLLPMLPLLWACSTSQQPEVPAGKAAADNSHTAQLGDEEGDRREAKGALEFRRATMRSADGTIVERGLARAMDHRSASLATDFSTGGIQKGSWSWLGPGEVGGRCRALWIDRVYTNTLVLGSVSGGIWRSEDAGASWVSVDDFPASMAIGCMAGSPGNGPVIWAGTGEDFGNTDGMQGNGIYRSGDRGKSWHLIKATDNVNFSYVNRIAFHPLNRDVVLVATSRGIFRTTDGGDNLDRVLTGRMLDLSFNPKNGNEAVAAGVGNLSVRYSADAGRTWPNATGIPSGVGRIELAYAPSDPRIVYASVDVPGAASRIYKSADGGRSYLLVSAGNVLGGQGYYNNCIWVDPVNSKIVVVGGIKLFRSTNGGASFTNISWPHVDYHVILAHPSFNGGNIRSLYVCNDGGIYRTDDIYAASNSSAGWTKLNNRLGITQFYDGAVSASGRPYGGTQDNGTQQLENTLSKSFRGLWGADGLQCEADPVDPKVLFGEGQYVGVFRSLDGGNNCYEIKNNLADSGNSARAPFSGAMRLDPNNTNRLWIGSKRVWRTDNAKDPNHQKVYWRVVCSEPGGPFTAVEVAPSNSDIVVVGTHNGALFRSTNATSTSPTWSRIGRNGLPGRYVTRIRIDRFNANKIWVSFGGYSNQNVWRSPDGGLNWFLASGSGTQGLPPAPVRGLELHPHNEGWVYAGTEVGIYASTDGGRNWSTDNEGPAAVSVDDIVVRDNGSIYAFTYGRGVYRAHAGTPEDPLAGTTRADLTWLAAESDGHSYRSELNQDGRWVVFGSEATNLVPLDTNGSRDIYIRDRQAGTTERLSVTTSGRQANGASAVPSISPGGRYVAFESAASNLVSDDTNGKRDIFIRDRVMTRTDIISRGADRKPANGDSYAPSFTEDGRSVVFYSYATNLDTRPDTNNTADVFVCRRHGGVFDRITRVSVAMNGAAASGGSFVSPGCVSGNGIYTVFHSLATNLVPNDTNGTADVFQFDYLYGQNKMKRVSNSYTGGPANGPSYQASISADSRFVAFFSLASNLVPGDTNNQADVFLWDKNAKKILLISRGARGGPIGNQKSYGPMISRNGEWVVFESAASNLVSGDTNGRTDVFAYHVPTQDLVLVSRSSVGGLGNQNSTVPAISGDGKYISFYSSASNLVPFDTNKKIDVFVVENGLTKTVFPRALAGIVGNTSTTLPLGSSNTRLQQVYRETKGQMMNVRRVAFRRAPTTNNNSSEARSIELGMHLGDSNIDKLSTSFNNNWIGAPQEVIRRKRFALPDWRGQVPAPAAFDAALPLDQAYQHSGKWQLGMEISTYANTLAGGHIADAYSGNLTVFASSDPVGNGCATSAGPNFNHVIGYRSDGPSSEVEFLVSQAEPNAPVALALGTKNPKLKIPGWCAPLYTDALIIAPLGAANGKGAIDLKLPGGAFNPNSAGKVLYTQCYSPTGKGAFSQGLRFEMPILSPGPAARRVFASPRSSATGTLQDLAAVLRLDY